MDYKYGTKNNWRRWMWNRIAEQTKDRKNAIVLFLAGDGLDIKEARLRGFDSRNMIAVENSKPSLIALREKKILAIDGDLLNVMESWPNEKPVAVVVADFCCGLEDKIIKNIAYNTNHRYPFANTTFAFNFLRGRDSSSNEQRQMHEKSNRIQNKKHRGELFFSTYITGIVTRSFTAHFGDESFYDHENELKSAFDNVSRWAEPSFQSYRSSAGNQVFDSIVFKNVLARGMSLVPSDVPKTPIFTGAIGDQRRKISAILAHRTRQMSA